MRWYKLEAATHFLSIILGGSLIPIVIICLRHAQGGDGDGSFLAKHIQACGFEAATLFTSTLMGGSLIPIVVIGMGMALTTGMTNTASITEIS